MRLAIVLLLSLFASSAFAQSAENKFDFTQSLKDQDGNDMWECADLRDKDCKERSSVTLGAIVFRALSAPEQSIPLEESFKRGKLAMEVYKGKNVALTAEDIVLIKKQVAKVFSPIIVYRVVQTLDPQSK